MQLEPSAKKQSFIGGNPKSELWLLSSEIYPRFEVLFGSDDSFRPAIIIDAEEFIGVKSFKAKGKRISNFTIAEVKELEPREETEDENETVEIEDEEIIIEDDTPKSYNEIIDELTGQQKIFED